MVPNSLRLNVGDKYKGHEVFDWGVGDDDRLVLCDCLVDGHHGIYVPQVFASLIKKGGMFEGFGPIKLSDIRILLNGPKEEFYWEVFFDLMNNLTYVDPHGLIWRLESGESGDLFMVHDLSY